MGTLRQTYTYVTLEVSSITFAEIAGKLRAAGYEFAFVTDGEIDMHGLALVREAPRDPQAKPEEQLNEFCKNPPCASVACRKMGRCQHE